jgi:hypothetical protein
MPKDYEGYKFGVYATQGGGLARDANGKLIFIEAPDCPGLGVGDEVPREWDIVPLNKIAHDELSEGQFGID